MKISKEMLSGKREYKDKDFNTVERENTDSVDDPENAVAVQCYDVLSVHDIIYKINRPTDKCNHPRKFRRKMDGWIDGIKGCECTKCHRMKVGPVLMPFALMKWQSAPHWTKLMEGVSTVSNRLATAIIKSGDYTARETMFLLSQCCERCLNVLERKYLGESEGYEEYSEEWKKCGTSCRFCEDEK